MSMTEILEELPKLAPSQREELWRRLEELELGLIEETPVTLAAIDAGRQSVREGKTHSVDKVRELITQWTTRSS
jgi:hypothetical protein